jgi:hypothetical protein
MNYKRVRFLISFQESTLDGMVLGFTETRGRRDDPKFWITLGDMTQPEMPLRRLQPGKIL